MVLGDKPYEYGDILSNTFWIHFTKCQFIVSMRSQINVGLSKITHLKLHGEKSLTEIPDEYKYPCEKKIEILNEGSQYLFSTWTMRIPRCYTKKWKNPSPL